MDIGSSVLLVITIIAAVSYGWGMRGTTIGGEKGAMLPGAIIGLLIAMFSNILIVKEHFYIFSALGAVSMYFGGSMTYGETLGLSMNKNPAENMKKGLIALFIKGFLWFGCFGAIFTTGINAVCYVYKFTELLIIIVLTPLIAVGCYFLFNKPLKPHESKFPKIYFSKTRQESWGALLGIFITLTAFAIIKHNTLTIVFAFVCALFGGCGWILGQLLQIYSIHYAENSTSSIGRLLASKKGVDSWKIMECVLGAFGGLGAAISFIITYDNFSDTVFTLEKNGGLLPFNKIISILFFIIWLLLLIGDCVHYFIKKPITKKELKKQLDKKLISQNEYSIKLLKAVDTVPKAYDIYFKITEKIEPILYAAIPFVLICFGSKQATVATSFLLVFLVLCQEVALEKVISPIFNLLLKVLFGEFIFVIFITQIIFNLNSSTLTIILYTVIYEFLTLVWLIPQIIRKAKNTDEDSETKEKKICKYFKIIKNNKSFLSVHVYFIICILVTLFFFK